MESSSNISRATQYTIVLIAFLAGVVLLLLDRFGEQLGIVSKSIIYTAVISVPAYYVLASEDIKNKSVWILSGIYFLVMLLLGAYSGYQCTPTDKVYCASEFWVFELLLPLFVMWFIVLFFSQAWLRSGRFSYSSLFDASWDNYITINLTYIFVGIFWGLLLLWIALFELIDVRFFEKLFESPWFYFPVTGLVAGVGVVIFRTQVNAVLVLRRILRALMKWLLPLLALMSLIFLVSLIFVGLQPLWNTRSATSISLWLVCLILLFTNAVYQDSHAELAYKKPFEYLVKAAVVLTPVYVAIAAYALYLRVAQYAWSVERLWVLIIVVMLAGFTLSYAFAILRYRQQWLDFATRANRVMAVIIALICLLVSTPLINLKSISAGSQVARLKSGAIAAADFDYNYMRYQLQRPGYEALMAIKADTSIKNHKEVELRVDEIMKSESRWATTGTSARVASAQQISEYLQLYPQDMQIPQGLSQYLYEHRDDKASCYIVRLSCVLLRADVSGDAENEYVLFTNRNYLTNARVYQLVAGQWVPSGRVIAPQHWVKNFTDALQRKDVSIEEHDWRVLRIGEQEIIISDDVQ